MAIIKRKTKLGERRYIVRIQDRYGQFFPSKVFSRRADAVRYESELKLKKSKGREARDLSKQKILFKDYLDEWFEMRRGKISVGWFNSQKQMATKYVVEKIGNRSLSEIGPPQIGKIFQSMRDLNLSPQSILHVYKLLVTIFKDAVEYYGYMDRSPVLRQDRPKVPRVERKYLTPAESWKLLEACQNHYLGPAIWLAVLCGLRTSEVQALQWRAVDFENGQILICAAYKRSIREIEPFPKQKDWLHVPMPTVLAEYLLSTCKHRFKMGFVAPALQGGMLEQKKFHNGLRRLCQDAGVTVVSPHELRHSCTEIWFRSGANLEDIRRLLGHKSSETTLRYVHQSNSRLTELAKTISFPK